jgi:hypothetical protein
MKRKFLNYWGTVQTKFKPTITISENTRRWISKKEGTCHASTGSYFKFFTNSRRKQSVWRIRDVYPGSGIPDPTYFHPGSRIRTVSIPDPGSGSATLKTAYLVDMHEYLMHHKLIPEPVKELFWKVEGEKWGLPKSSSSSSSRTSVLTT